jgi:hypothetical protein
MKEQTKYFLIMSSNSMTFFKISFKFKKKLFELLNVKVKLSSTFHTEMDGEID